MLMNQSNSSSWHPFIAIAQSNLSTCAWFGWGKLVTVVPLTYNTTTNDPTEFGDLLNNFAIVPIKRVIYNGSKSWSSIDSNTKSVKSCDISTIDSSQSADDQPVFQTPQIICDCKMSWRSCWSSQLEDDPTSFKWLSMESSKQWRRWIPSWWSNLVENTPAQKFATINTEDHSEFPPVQPQILNFNDVLKKVEQAYQKILLWNKW